MKFDVTLEDRRGREVAHAKADENTLVSIIRAFCRDSRANVLFVNGKGYCSEREALAGLVAANRYSMQCGGERIYLGV